MTAANALTPQPLTFDSSSSSTIEKKESYNILQV
jgi:hypothetical protein